MGNGLSRGRHKKGELPVPQVETIPLSVRPRPPPRPRRPIAKHPSSLQLEVPDLCYTEPPSACQSLNDLDQDFKLNGLNGDIGLSKDFLCVPGSLQEVMKFVSFRR